MSEEFIEVEEYIDVAATIPVHLRDYTTIEFASTDEREFYVTIDGQELKGDIDDSIGSTLFFEIDEATGEAKVVSSVDKVIHLEHFVRVPPEEFSKPFYLEILLGKCIS